MGIFKKITKELFNQWTAVLAFQVVNGECIVCGNKGRVLRVIGKEHICQYCVLRGIIYASKAAVKDRERVVGENCSWCKYGDKHDDIEVDWCSLFDEGAHPLSWCDSYKKVAK